MRTPRPIGPTTHAGRLLLAAVLLAGTAWPVPAQGDEKTDKLKGMEPKRPPGKAANLLSPAGAPPAAVAPAAAPAPAAAGDAPQIIGAQNIELPPPVPGTYRIGPYSEPVDVKLLVDLIAQELQIQVIASDIALADKKIWLLTHVDVPRDRLLEFLGYLLERNGQYITREADFVWVIKPVTDLQGQPNVDKLSTTQVLPTKGIRPTSLSGAIAQLLAAGGGGGAPGQPQVQGAVRVTYLDDLGILIINDTPRRIALVQSLIDRIADEQLQLQFTRFEVRHISATTAKARILELMGRTMRNVVQNFNPGDPNQALQAQQQNIGGTSSSNLTDRLVPEGNSNSLILRGRPEEVTLIERLLGVVDVVNNLVPKWYPVGPAAFPLAEQAKRQGLGDVTVMQSQRTNSNSPFAQQGFEGQQAQFRGPTAGSGDQSGPVFVLDPEQRGFMYYGTPDQHIRVQQLVEEFKEPIQAERIIYEFYKLRFADAEKTAEIIRGMITNTVPAGESPLIPGQGSNSGSRSATSRVNNIGRQAMSPDTPEGTIGEIVASDQVFVLPDKGNNQVIVKAPSRLQAQFQRLVERLDQRRMQVYIDSKVVVVSDTDDFRLTVETMLLNANGTGGALRTKFLPDLTSPGTPNNGLLTPPIVNPLSGLTTAIIKSDQVPIIINALQTQTDSRIVASPQILVDDNEEAEISSIEQRAKSKTTQNPTGGPTTSFDDYESAGPRLKVKPRISTSDILSLKYEVELSSFLAGTGDSNLGIPPDRQENKVRSDSATIPGDSTIVVGGLTFEEDANTVIKVPFIGDIPLVGELFKSTNKIKRKRIIFVFLTPRILRDPTGSDLRLFTKGPASAVNINTELPEMKPEQMEILLEPPQIRSSFPPVPAAPASAPAPASEAPAPALPEPAPAEPASTEPAPTNP